MRSQALISCSHCPPLWAFWNKEFFQPHGVWKSPKSLILHCQRSELRLHFEWKKVNKKMTKMFHFGEFLKTWRLRSINGTRQLIFEDKNSNQFGVIFQTMWTSFFSFCMWMRLNIIDWQDSTVVPNWFLITIISAWWMTWHCWSSRLHHHHHSHVLQTHWGVELWSRFVAISFSNAFWPEQRG